jgi:hypothetical protein
MGKLQEELERVAALDSRFAEALELAKQLAERPFDVGATHAGKARVHAVRQLIASAREPLKVIKRNPGAAGPIAGWLMQRAHELRLAKDRKDRAAELEARLRDTEKPCTELTAARFVLEACGVPRKTAHNWIDSAIRPGAPCVEPGGGLGQRVRVAEGQLVPSVSLLQGRAEKPLP